MTDNAAQIATNALAPQSVSADGVSVTQHSIADQIAADRYARSKAALANPAGALKRVKLVPPGGI